MMDMMDMMVDDMPDTAEIFPDLPDSPENGSGQIRTDQDRSGQITAFVFFQVILMPENLMRI